MPLVGTWIEIRNIIKSRKPVIVVPLVGTWIEIRRRALHSTGGGRRAPRGHVD